MKGWEQQAADDSPIRMIRDKSCKATTPSALEKVLVEAMDVLSELDASEDEEQRAHIPPLQDEIQKIKEKIKAVERAQEEALKQQAQTFRERIENLCRSPPHTKLVIERFTIGSFEL